MIWFLYAFALFWIAAGTLFILYTEESRRIFNVFMDRTKPRSLAFIPIVVGLLLITSVWASGAFWFILILGLLAIGKGVYLLLGPLDQIKGLFDWWFKSARERTYRFWGIVMVILGMAILSWV